MKLIEPPPLKKGDTIGIIAPSAGLSAIFPHRIDKAIEYFKSEGYKIKEFRNVRKSKKWESASPEERSKEIMEAFEDKEVKAIICEIGGTTANKTLNFLDFKKIRKNPKIFCGYSDISVLHYAIYKKSRLMTYYGPSIMVQFAEYPYPLEHTKEYFNRAVSIGKIGKIDPSDEWTDETLDWNKKEDQKRARKFKKNKGFEWIKKGFAEGPIIGGCLHSILHLLGTKYWPSHKNKILFLDIPEGENFDRAFPISELDAELIDLENAGVFKKIKGLIIGRPFKYSEKKEKELKETILDNLKKYNFPVLYGADIGHTDPQITIPLGRKTRINSNTNLFEIS